MNAGKIEQFARPSELYARPATPFVMDFIGISTRLTGTVTDQSDHSVTVETAFGPIRALGNVAVGRKVVLGIRPELISPEPGENTIEVTLTDAMVLGAKTQLHAKASDPDRVLCELPGIREGLARGQTLSLSWSVADTLLHEADA